MENTVTMEKIVSLCKRRGFIFQGSEIYGGLAGTFDYGPYGVTLKKNIENLWWKMFVDERTDMYGIDAAILMNPKAWVASGHVGGFSDPMVDCLKCGKRERTDNLMGEKTLEYFEFLKSFSESLGEENSKSLDNLEEVGKVLEGQKKIETEKLEQFVANGGEVEDYKFSDLNTLNFPSDYDVLGIGSRIRAYGEGVKFLGQLPSFFLNTKTSKTCSVCKSLNWSDSRQFNMMFSTNVGPVQSEDSVTYLRPETAGGMFVNFKNVVDSFHPKLPFGLGQIGKAFRNEIAPRDFIFRVRELEQMEIEYFVHPDTWEENFEKWRLSMHEFIKQIGLESEKVHELEVSSEDRAHYSKRTIDFEFDYPFGRKELYGLAYRGDFDLSAHKLDYFDEEISKTKITPHVIEPSFGVGRTILAVLCSAYKEDATDPADIRPYLAFTPRIAPVKIAIFPLLKNKEALTNKAKEIYAELKKEFTFVSYDETGSIGKRYRRQDEIGTPYCLTVDFDTLEKDGTVTLRDRDTGAQERLSISEVAGKLRSVLNS